MIVSMLIWYKLTLKLKLSHVFKVIGGEWRSLLSREMKRNDKRNET